MGSLWIQTYRLNPSKPSSQESRGFNHGSVKPIEIENAKGRCPKTPAQRLTGDAFRGTPPVSAISPKKSLRTALKMGRS